MTFQLVKDSNRTATGAVNTAPNGTPTKPRDVRKALSFGAAQFAAVLFETAKDGPSVNPNKTRKIANPIKADPPKQQSLFLQQKRSQFQKIDQAVAATIHTNFGPFYLKKYLLIKNQSCNRNQNTLI